MNPPAIHYKSLPWAENASKIYKYGQVVVGMGSGHEPRLDFYNSTSSNLPAYLIYVVFKITLGEGWVEELEKIHRQRPGLWKTEVCLNQEGWEEYRLYTLKQDKPICSSRISIANSRIHSFSIGAEDVAPLLKKVIENYPPVFLPKLKNYRYTYFFPGYLPFYSLNKASTRLGEEMSRQREETRKITADENTLQTGACWAGDSSGLLETIEALKCLEVFMA
ncbi:hypothetical protein Dhaf_1911 [Desulfitobacterium hafniense DCB-2]|uniref:Uncharacterized protein n=2 Tax=Desulfitobacterium hafniense TaxID=49338 RepID=A0A098B481_DESHA|nr:hypothetical protein [Desulfitobacterium hafniense]ACL19951.1 hypothetical protein Dhaf_1911 [Desulfitobacterium hafniense DCB-2]CDX03693.1 Hypothetical protein DPCES_3807 [Desulfitobacterium hafniense]